MTIRSAMSDRAFEAQHRDLAELPDRLVSLGPVVVAEPALQLGEDLVGRAAGRPDEEHPVETVLVGGVAGRQPARRVAVGRVDPGLLALRVLDVVAVAGPFPDSGVAGQRGLELVFSKAGRRLLGRLAE